MRRLVGWLLALAAGFVAGVLAAPMKGRRSRALLRDKAVHTARVAERRRTRLARRTRGWAHHLRWLGWRRPVVGPAETLTPQEIAARVETALGRIRGLREHINVNVEGYTVMLRGQADPRAAREAERTAAAVPGVEAVRNLVRTK